VISGLWTINGGQKNAGWGSWYPMSEDPDLGHPAPGRHPAIIQLGSKWPSFDR
jgi:hypothetical protein